MVVEAMPNELKKRRVLYLEDRCWEKVLKLSNEERISKSAALRKILEEVT